MRPFNYPPPSLLIPRYISYFIKSTPPHPIPSSHHLPTHKSNAAHYPPHPLTHSITLTYTHHPSNFITLRYITVGGCQCAGPFSQHILGLSNEDNKKIELALLDKHEVLTSGIWYLILDPC